MKIAINGFGRIGRAVLRVALDRGVQVVAVNDVHGVESSAYLLKHDSVYGLYKKKVEVKGENLVVGGKRIKIISEREPLKLPWKKLGVDVVVEATGAFRERVKAGKHLTAGARYVLVSAPAKGMDITLVPGVNNDKLRKGHKLISVASCTTNCLAPLVKVLHENFVIEDAFMTTIHGYTSSQSLVDGYHKKAVRGRAAALNIVLTTTGATKAVIEAYPVLKGKINGMAIRVPVAVGSVVDLVAKVKKNVSVDLVNGAFKKIAKKEMKGILEYSEEPLVSTDIIGNTHSAIFSSLNTQIEGDLVKVLAWYDNEYGYSSRVVDVVRMLR